MACDPYGDHNQLISLLLSTLFLLLLTHGVTFSRPGPLSTGAAIDILIHSVEVAHFTHTMEPMASYSHSGGPTTFQQNSPIAMTLLRPLRPTLHWDQSWVTEPTKGKTTTVVANKQSKIWTRYHNNNKSTRLCLLTGPG